MTDRTANTTFDPQSHTMFLSGTTNASNGDTIDLPNGRRAKQIIATALTDVDAIVGVSTIDTAKDTITFTAVDDAGAAITADLDIDFCVILENQ